jgi:hypothetical protein
MKHWSSGGSLLDVAAGIEDATRIANRAHGALSHLKLVEP